MVDLGIIYQSTIRQENLNLLILTRKSVFCYGKTSILAILHHRAQLTREKPQNEKQFYGNLKTKATNNLRFY